MSTTVQAATAYVTPDTTSQARSRAMWERLWRMSGVQFVVLVIIAIAVRGMQPELGASRSTLASFYDGRHVRVCIAAALIGLAVINLMWFAAAMRNTLAESGQDGWGMAVVASSAAVAIVFLLYFTIGAGISLSTQSSPNTGLTSGLNGVAWATFVAVAWPRAMLIMSGSFGLWRAQLISNRLFGACVVLVVASVVAGTTWASSGFWAPNGGYSSLIATVMLVWVLVVSRVLARTPAARAGW